ncbi:5-oxoprolinase subunit B/C family protein [Naumannella huperziae]
MSERRHLSAGDRAVLVELVDLEHTLGLLASLRQRQRVDPIPGLGEPLPAARTIMIDFCPEVITRAELITELAALSDEPRPAGDGPPIEIDVVYDGEDLDEVAGLLGLTRDDLIARHTGGEWVAAFAGFAPGFAYLAGGDPIFDVPRRSSPRTRIPAGSVGLAGRFSGVYPRESPGGWQLIGRTAATMWEADRDPPALLAPGTRVRFRAVAQLATTAPAPDPAAEPDHDRGLEVIIPGLQSTLQDAGRPGNLAMGVAVSGALDIRAMRLANGLVGNVPDEAILEIPYGALTLRARGRCVVAVTGARVGVIITRSGGEQVVVDDQRPLALDDGDELALGVPAGGVRAMLAARGGFAVDAVLGSRSTDTLGGIGPPPLRAGQVLGLRDIVPPARAVGDPVPWPDEPSGSLEVPIMLGPRDDWFDADSVQRLVTEPWLVTERSDRVGLRLGGGRPLVRTEQRELPSEGVATGSLQVPPSGEPILFLADHPITGGYPVIAVVDSTALGALGQAPPGTELRFRLSDREG